MKKSRTRTFLTALVVILALAPFKAFAAAPADQWWDLSYPFRQQVTLTSGTAMVPNSYTISITIDHQTLVGAGQSLASGNDVRVLYWNGGGWVELDRVLDPVSAWNSTTTTINFRTQALIPASSSDDNYYVYYGNLAAAAPPANETNVYAFWDDFDDNDISDWTAFTENRALDASCNPAGFPAVSVTGGIVNLDPVDDWCTAGIRNNAFSVSNAEGFTVRTGARYVDPAFDDDQLPGMWYVQIDGSNYLTQAYNASTRGNTGTASNRIRALQPNLLPPNFDVVNGASGSSSVPTINTWYDYENFVLTNGDMRWERDGTQHSPTAGWGNDTTFTAGGIALGSERIAAEYDWVLVRKLVGPEPTNLVSPPTGAISGNVFEDVNGDGNPADAVGRPFVTVVF